MCEVGCEREGERGGAEAERCGGKGGQEWKIASSGRRFQILESRILFSLDQTTTVDAMCNNSRT